ncbi:MAG TPA: ATP-binding cassette domain-containing protein [Acidimicrobiales bacterium]|nr:ATP-binding cassette domain-containing protein [Acidimicrobiales bacterium]
MAEVVYDKATCMYEGSDRPAVDALDLEIRDGEFVVLVGPSGSGKTTALRMLAGLEEIDEGSIRIAGRDMVGVPSRDRDIAMVFQNYALYPNKTVSENMGFSLKMHGVPKDERDRRVRDAAGLLDLGELLDRKPRHLSGGQRQRVAMGRAIVREPKVFCMDEPLSNLDAQLRVQTRTQIAELQRRLKVTTVYVTHDQVEAMTMGDRVAVLRNGVLQQADTPTELYDHPANVFVAGFIGSPAMNRLAGKPAEGGVAVGRVHLPAPRPVQEHPELVVGIRPEHLSLSAEGELELQVDIVEDLGSDSYVYGHLLDGETAATTGDGAGNQANGSPPGEHSTTVIVRAGRAHPQPGEKVRAKVDVDQLHLFDARSGLRIS